MEALIGHHLQRLLRHLLSACAGHPSGGLFHTGLKGEEESCEFRAHACFYFTLRRLRHFGCQMD